MKDSKIRPVIAAVVSTMGRALSRVVLGCALAWPAMQSAEALEGPYAPVQNCKAKAGRAVAPLSVDACGAVIGNGTLQMGVNCEGHLNYPFVDDPLGIGFMGLRFVPTGAASTEPGCQCEGWGVADVTSGVAGFANVTSDNGANNLTLLSFTADATSAVSTVQVGSTFRVTHSYRPSLETPSLYDVLVTITNISDAATEVLYRRVMDWDVYPTPFEEYVTIVNGNAASLYRTDTNGFNSANPFSFETYEPGPVTDVGPDDHGALFDFNFGTLEPDASLTFRTLYGAAPTESAALAALTSVGAEAYSLGQPSTENGPTLGEPNTFVFAFAGIGGNPVGCGNGALDAGEQCDDGNTASGDGCDANCTTTSCGNGVVTAGEPCDDGNDVNADCCSNTCQSASPGSSCDLDGNLCTADQCNGSGGCTATEQAVQCDDGNQCNGNESCNPLSGCIAGTTPNPLPSACSGCCSTGASSCTGPIDAAGCSSVEGTFVDNATCGDGVCNANAVCGNGVVDAGEDCDSGASGGVDCCDGTTCQFQDVGSACSTDGNVCTDDVCGATGECTHSNNTVPCDDSDICTGDDSCSEGACTGSPVVPPSCDDGNVCTDDSCSANHCGHTNNAVACDDGEFCTDNDTCSDGSCAAGAPRDCGAGNACIIASCDEDSDQCITAPDPGQNGQACNDGSVCTEGTTCSAGVCGGGATLNCNDSDACTADSCDPSSGCVNTVTIESRACDSCEDAIDNDDSGETDYADCSCNLLCESFDYAVIGTRPTSRRTVYLGGDTHVDRATISGGVEYDSRASVCAQRELAVIAAATIDGAVAVRQNAVFGTGDNMLLGFFAGLIPPGILTTTGQAPVVGPGGLLLTDPANLFPAGHVDLSGTHEEYADCGLAIDSLIPDRDALLALTPTVDLGAVTHKIGDPPLVVVGPGPHVLHMSRLRVRGRALLEISGDADAVVVVQVDRGFSIAQRAGVQVSGGLRASNLIWVLDRSGRVYIGSDTEVEPDDADAVFAGTVLAPGRNIVVGKRSRVTGALLGRKVQLNGQVVVSHHPFTGVGP